VTALLAAGTTISWPLAGVLSDRVGRRKPFFLVSQATWIAVAVVFTLSEGRLGPGGAGVVTAIAGLLFGGTILPYLMAVELFSPDIAATAASVVNGAALVGGILVPVMIGRIIDVSGSFSTAFAVTAGLHVAAFACALLIPETGWARGRT
jgi:MFS family permease